jgi:FAD/FMN-containing dehydrogenase
LRRASATENADLFWGVRGGGGNFGIVTSFEFKLHPMSRQVIAGDIVFPFSKAKEALTIFAEYGPKVSDDFYLGFAAALPPGGQPGVAAFHICHLGSANAAERELAPLRKLGTPIADTVRSMDYVALQKSGDISDQRANASYLKSGFIPTFPGDLVDAILEGFSGDPRRSTAVFFQQGGGAISRVSNGATAFAQRDIRANMLCAVDWKHGDDPSAHVAWIKKYWQPLERFTDGFYINDPDPDHTASVIQANFRANHARLVTVKNKYDPKNLFRLNSNVRPTAKS